MECFIFYTFFWLSSVEDERNGSRSIAWGVGVRMWRWVTPCSGSRGMMGRSVTSGAWLGRARKWEWGMTGVKSPSG